MTRISYTIKKKYYKLKNLFTETFYKVEEMNHTGFFVSFGLQRITFSAPMATFTCAPVPTDTSHNENLSTVLELLYNSWDLNMCNAEPQSHIG